MVDNKVNRVHRVKDRIKMGISKVTKAKMVEIILMAIMTERKLLKML